MIRIRNKTEYFQLVSLNKWDTSDHHPPPPSINHFRVFTNIKMVDIISVTPHPQGKGIGKWNPSDLSDKRAHEAGKNVLEEEMEVTLEKLVENRSLLQFWEGLDRLGVGTNSIESRAKKFEIEKLSKEGQNFSKREGRESQ